MYAETKRGLQKDSDRVRAPRFSPPRLCCPLVDTNSHFFLEQHGARSCWLLSHLCGHQGLTSHSALRFSFRHSSGNFRSSFNSITKYILLTFQYGNI